MRRLILPVTNSSSRKSLILPALHDRRYRWNCKSFRVLILEARKADEFGKKTR